MNKAIQICDFKHLQFIYEAQFVRNIKIYLSRIIMMGDGRISSRISCFESYL